MCPIGRDDADIYLLIEKSLTANLLYVLLKRLQGEFGLVGIDSAKVFANKLLVLEMFRCLNPLDGGVELEYRLMANLWCRLHFPLIEPLTGELHDGLVHAVLYLQECHLLGVVFHDALH